jgi:SAM-dependent methyltransferase
MDVAAFAAEADAEETHWWFVGRRLLFAGVIERLGLPSKSRILDVGTSTGTNLRLLKDLGYVDVVGLDASPEAIRYCEEKGLGSVKMGNICAMPFDEGTFDLVLATDVIEHVDDDAGAVCEIARVLAPGGHVLITVPAFKSLWGLQDRQALHKRRYRKSEVLKLTNHAGLLAEQHYYFNYLLFVPIWCARRLIDIFGTSLDSESQINTPMLNRLLKVVFLCDVNTAPHFRMPFGVSALVLARKRQ